MTAIPFRCDRCGDRVLLAPDASYDQRKCKKCGARYQAEIASVGRPSGRSSRSLVTSVVVIFLGFTLAVVLYIFLQRPQSPATSEAPDTVDLSETNMEIGACAGRLMWLAAFTKKAAPTDPRTTEMQQLAFWFQRQANEIAGQKNGMALSYKTMEWLNDRYKKIGEKPLLVELMADTWSCPDTVMKLRPNTKACFELEQSSTPLTPLAYKFKCARQ